MTSNVQNTFLSRQRLGTPGSIARAVNKPITEVAITPTTVSPGQGVMLTFIDSKLNAFSPTTRDEQLQVRAIVMLRANSLPDSAGDIIYAAGSVVEVMLSGFIYVATDGTLAQPFTPALAEQDSEWVPFVPSGTEQRISPMSFVQPTQLDFDNLSDIDNETQIVYLPPQSLDRAVDSTGTPI